MKTAWIPSILLLVLTSLAQAQETGGVRVLTRGNAAMMPCKDRSGRVYKHVQVPLCCNYTVADQSEISQRFSRGPSCVPGQRRMRRAASTDICPEAAAKWFYTELEPPRDMFNFERAMRSRMVEDACQMYADGRHGYRCFASKADCLRSPDVHRDIELRFQKLIRPYANVSVQKRQFQAVDPRNPGSGFRLTPVSPGTR